MSPIIDVLYERVIYIYVTSIIIDIIFEQNVSEKFLTDLKLFVKKQKKTTRRYLTNNNIIPDKVCKNTFFQEQVIKIIFII